MKRITILFAGAALTLAAFGARANSESAERYRAKYGRYPKAEETREKAAAKIEAPACCRNMNVSFIYGPPEDFAEALFRGKYGRSTPRVEAREKLVAEANAKHVRTCVELGECRLMQSEERAVATAKAAPAGSSRDESYRAKYGRALPTTREDVPVAAGKVTCAHECCRRAD